MLCHCGRSPLVSLQRNPWKIGSASRQGKGKGREGKGQGDREEKERKAGRGEKGREREDLPLYTKGGRVDTPVSNYQS